MKKTEYSPYGSFSFEKIDAPKGKEKGAPRSTKRTSKGDLRIKGGK